MRIRLWVGIAVVACVVNVGLTARSFYNYTTVIGEEAEAVGDFGTVYGYRAKAGLNSVAMRGVCEGSASTCVGDGAYGGGPTALDNVNIGDDNKVVMANDAGATGVGRAQFVNKYATAVGHNVQVAPFGFALGESVTVNHWGSGALGRHAVTSREQQIAIGSASEPIRELMFNGGTFHLFIGVGDPALNGPASNAVSGSPYFRIGEPTYSGPRFYMKQGATWVPVS